MTSQTNLTGLGKNLSVRFLDQLPELQSSQRSMSSGSPGHDNIRPSSAALQEVQPDLLPRTRSQLSVMVDHERKLGGLKQAEGRENKASNPRKVSQDKQDASSEEEGIVMGIGVGKTKVTRKGKKSDKRKDALANNYSQAPDPVW